MGSEAPGPASTSGHDRSLIDRLVRRGWEFDFFPAVWLLERFAAGGAPVGGVGPVSAERIRFRPEVSMVFPATDVRRATVVDGPSEDESIYQIDVTFMGLYGVSTPLPLHYAVDVLRSVDHSRSGANVEGVESARPARETGEEGGSPLRDFLDLFHHRLISFFYRSWLKYRFERSFALSGRDDIAGYLLWFIGCSPGVDAETLGVPPIRLLRYAGVLTQHPRSGMTLAGVLRDYWNDPSIGVETCLGRWVRVSSADQNRLGEANSRVGFDVTLGEQVYDLNGTFLVRIGPMGWEEYLSFLPDGTRTAQTRALIRYYCMDPLACTLELRIRAGEVPSLRIGSDESAGRLGFTSWVRTDVLGEVSVQFADGASAARPNGDRFAAGRRRREAAA